MIPRERLHEYYLLTRLHRPIGIYLLLWPTLWALWIAADGFPDPGVLTVFVLGTVLMRSAGCVINDYADRHIDPHVERTRERPLAAGRVTEREALGLFAVLLLAAFLLVLTMNRLTILLSFAGAGLAALYPFTKRVTHLPQVVLGAAFGWAIPMAFAAQSGAVPRVAWFVFLAGLLWAVIYDTMYAMADRPDDLKIGVKSSAILFGRHDRLIIGLLQLLFFADLLWIGVMAERGIHYHGGLMVAAGLALHHQWLIRTREPAACFHAFLHNNWLGLAVFAGLLLDYAL